MFIRKKPFWQRKWFYCVIVGVLAFGYWANRDLPVIPDEGQTVMEETPVGNDLGDIDAFVKNERILPDEVLHASLNKDGIISSKGTENRPDSGSDELSANNGTGGPPSLESEDPEAVKAHYLIREEQGVIQVLHSFIFPVQKLLKLFVFLCESEEFLRGFFGYLYSMG